MLDYLFPSQKVILLRFQLEAYGRTGNLLDLVIKDSNERFIDMNTLLGHAERTHIVITWKYFASDLSEKIYHEK